jgi:hypothetical protein
MKLGMVSTGAAGFKQEAAAAAAAKCAAVLADEHYGRWLLKKLVAWADTLSDRMVVFTQGLCCLAICSRDWG